MAKCDICGKGVTFGIKVSHSHRRSNRMWKPNVKRVKAIVDGSPRHIHACTRCHSGYAVFYLGLPPFPRQPHSFVKNRHAPLK